MIGAGRRGGNLSRVPSQSPPVVHALTVRAARVPMPEPHRTASGVVAESPLVLTDVITDGGVVGHSIVFTYTAACRSGRRPI